MKKDTNILNLLAQLIATDSRSSKSNDRIISLVKRWFADYETKIQNWMRVSDRLKGKNLIVKIPGKSSNHALVFICHLDTVPPNDNWDTDPFLLKEKHGKLYGLGTCDTKGGIAALITAVFSLHKKPSYDTYLVFDVDEEETSIGVQEFLKICTIPQPVFIAIEPTDKQIQIAQRSVIHLDITTYGTAQHASKGLPGNNARQNAINRMLNIMRVLMQDAEKLAKEKDQLLGTNTQNFGTIHGGTARNVFADTCTLLMDRRILPTKDVEKELRRMRTIINAADENAKITVNSEPGFILQKDYPFVKQVFMHTQTLLPDAKLGTFPAWSEAGYTSAKGPSLVLGPGSLKGQAHKANEFVKKQELFDFVHIYRNIIEEIQL